MLLLFDIDGTLMLRASDAHKEAVYAGIAAVYGSDVPRARVETAGRTDPAIARSILTLAGVDARRVDDGMPAWRAATCEAYHRLCPPDLSARLAPGAHAVLERLAGDGHVLSLVTGNLQGVARLKLRRAGIGHFFGDDQGGFGSDDEDRAALPAIARRRAGATRRADAVVVGDTPLDIACARADDLRVVAITTGPHPAADLVAADAVVDRLDELPAALAALPPSGV